MNRAKLIDDIASAIMKADASYFNEDYTKQAQAVMAAIDKSGYVLTQKDFPKDIWQQVADKMRTGQMKPDDHVKNVYETLLKIIEAK